MCRDNHDPTFLDMPDKLRRLFHHPGEAKEYLAKVSRGGSTTIWLQIWIRLTLRRAPFFLESCATAADPRYRYITCTFVRRVFIFNRRRDSQIVVEPPDSVAGSSLTRPLQPNALRQNKRAMMCFSSQKHIMTVVLRKRYITVQQHVL